VWLVDDLPRKDRISVFGLHLHPFEGYSVPVVQLTPHHYAIDRPGTLAHHLSTAALHHVLCQHRCSSCLSERSAQQDGSSSPIGPFPLGDLLDEFPGASILYGRTARGDPKLAVDGFDLCSYGAGCDVEALRHLPGR
jgi:hypothetical protein